MPKSKKISASARRTSRAAIKPSVVKSVKTRTSKSAHRPVHGTAKSGADHAHKAKKSIAHAPAVVRAGAWNRVAHRLRKKAAKLRRSDRFTNAARFVSTDRFAKIFAASMVAVLLCTVLFWTILTARLHQANADQLIDAYLFENLQTFRQAVFPGAHSFMLKWPLFALMALLGNSLFVFMAATVLVVLCSVGALVYIIFRIEKRPLVFGLYCLALSSVLLLIPAQPYPGALLPVNMAMLTTRNLEYVLYILILYSGIRLRKIKSIHFAVVAFLSIVLIASDKLFAVLGILGGILGFVWYLATVRRQREALASGYWLLLLIPCVVIAFGLLRFIDGIGLTHIGNGDNASPYPLAHGPKEFVLAVLYAGLGMLTNMGANPVHGVIIVAEFPAALLHSVANVSIVPYAVNLGIVGACLFAAIGLLLHRNSPAKPRVDPDLWSQLSVLLLGSTIAAIAAFIITDHYYAVDARYMGVGLFALCISAATYYRRVEIPRRYILTASALLLVIVLPLGMHTFWREYQADAAALSGENRVTQRVSEELDRNKIGRLAGDYWDITPVKAKTMRNTSLLPVDQCTAPRLVLSSKSWFRQPRDTPLAYLAVKDPPSVPSRSTATYGGCTLAHIVSAYGVPSQRIAITDAQNSELQETPDVLLLMYPNGITGPIRSVHDSSHRRVPPAASRAKTIPEVSPFKAITEQDICSHGVTMQIVAHQDDDLLFMNPDVAHSIHDGRCMRTVYMTAGDAGEKVGYWGARENGAKSAYAEMYNMPNVWRDETQILNGHKFLVSTLQDAPQVSLVFLRLADGNLRGEGFPGHQFESLHNLVQSYIPQVHSVDSLSSYTKDELTAVLLEIMQKDSPDQIRTLGSDDMYDGDHADHHDAGSIAALASEQYAQPHTLQRYLGYPDKQLPVNLSDDDITAKQTTFLAYAKHDGAVCQTAFECQEMYTYGSYLTRMYIPISLQIHTTAE